MSAEVPLCKNCQQPVKGKFCSNCGEKVYAENEKSFKHLLEEVFHFLTHLDSKFLRSVYALFVRPGMMAAEFCRGVRKKYFKPVSLFLIGIIIYLFLPFLQGLNLSFNSNLQTFSAMKIGIVRSAALSKAEKKQISLEELGARYDSKSPKFAKILLFILLPLTGLLLMILFRKRKRYYFDHFILATETNTLFLYYAFLLLPLASYIIKEIIFLLSDYSVNQTSNWVFDLFGSLLIPFWAVALRRFYQVKWAKAIPLAILFFLLQSIIVFVIYRLILYFSVLLFI